MRFRHTLLTLVALLPLLGSAETQTFGPWDVHYTVLPTTQLSADIARSYDIPRANNTAFVNIAVTDNRVDTVQGETAEVTGAFRNLVGQSTTLTFREFDEGNAVYYIATFQFPHRERLRFTVTVAPDSDDQAYTLEFAQEIYREDRP